MSYQLLAWLLAGTFLTCCGCIVAVFGERRRARRLAALTQDMSDSQEVQAQTHVKLEESLRALNAKLAKTEGDCRRVLAANSKLNQELESRAAALRSVESGDRAHGEALAVMRAERDGLAQQLHEQRGLWERDSARIRELESELANTAQSVATLAQRGDEAQHDAWRERSQAHEHAQREIATLGARCAELERHLEQQLEGEQRQVREFEERVQARDAALRSQVAACEALRAEVNAKDASLAELAQRCGELEKTSRSRDWDLQTSATTLQSLQTELDARDRNLADLGRRCQGLEQHVSELNTALTGRQQELTERAASNDSLERELDAWRQKHNALVLRGEESVRLREQERETARALQQAAHDMECRLAERIGDLEATLDSRDKELRARSATFADLQREFTESQGRLVVLEQQHANLDRELQESHARSASLNERCEVTSHALEMRGRELIGRDQKLVTAAARVNDLHAELQRARASSETDRAPMDEMINGRLSTLFRRRADQVVASLPEPYAAGLARQDLSLALRGLLGDSTPLSTSAFARLGERWHDEYQAWKRSAVERKVVYLWADGVQVKRGTGENDPATLVLLAGFADGTRGVLALESGDRAAPDVWREAIRSLVERGMNVPSLVVADGDLGIWPALAELGWNGVQQYCWDHEVERSIAALPKCRRRRAGEMLQKISETETRSAAAKLRDLFVKRYCSHRPIAGERVRADWEHMARFFAFPKEHWHHLRTASVVASPLASMRLSTLAPKAWEHIEHVDALLWKLAVAADKTLRPLDAPELVALVAAGERCVDGVRRKRSKAA